jgi:hypothetical protein
MVLGIHPRALLRPIKRLVTACLPERTVIPPGFTPIREARPEDVFIVGYPRSGNTWFQNLVSGVIFGADPELTPDTVIQELVPDVHAKKCYKRFATPTYFKSHDVPGPEHRRVVYLLRDGRDAMVSFWNYIRVCRHPTLEFLEFVQHTQQWAGQGSWVEHVEQWLANPYHAAMMTIRYEDLLADPVRELRRFCAFVGLRPAPGHLESVAGRATFAKMRQKEISQAGWANESHAAWPKDQFFIRRGKVGSYQDEMPADVLKVFLQDAGPTLAKCGYLVKEAA